MDNVSRPEANVNDSDINRFGLNKYSLIGRVGGRVMGEIDPTPVEDIVADPDTYCVKSPDGWNNLKCGCPFSNNGYAPKGKGIAYKVSGDRFHFICYDDSHHHPNAREKTNKSGKTYWSYVVRIEDPNIVSHEKFLAIEFDAGERSDLLEVNDWMRSQKVSPSVIAYNSKSVKNYVIFRKPVGFSDKRPGEFVFKSDSIRMDTGFKFSSGEHWRYKEFGFDVDNESLPDAIKSVSNISVAAWKSLFISKELVEVLEDISSNAVAREPEADVVDDRDKHWEVYNRRMMGAAEKEIRANFKIDKFAHLLDGLGLDVDPDSDKDVEQQLADAVHAARGRAFCVRCRRAPHLVTTWSQGGAGHSNHTHLTCWMASCDDCKPFVLGSMASAIEVQVSKWMDDGYSVGVFTAPLGVLRDKSINKSIKNWVQPLRRVNRSYKDPHLQTSGLLKEKEIRGLQVTRKNCWIALRTHREVIYVFAHHPDHGGRHTPSCVTRGGAGFVPTNYSDLGAMFHSPESIPSSVDRIFTDVNAMDNAQLRGDILYGDRKSVKHVNSLRRSITGRGSSAKKSKEAKETQRKKDGVTDFKATVGYNMGGFYETVSDIVQQPITEHDTTAGGVFDKCRPGRLHLEGVNTTKAMDEAVINGRVNPAKSGYRRGTTLTIKSGNGISVTPIKTLEEMLDERGV